MPIPIHYRKAVFCHVPRSLSKAFCWALNKQPVWRLSARRHPTNTGHTTHRAFAKVRHTAKITALGKELAGYTANRRLSAKLNYVTGMCGRPLGQPSVVRPLQSVRPRSLSKIRHVLFHVHAAVSKPTVVTYLPFV